MPARRPHARAGPRSTGCATSRTVGPRSGRARGRRSRPGGAVAARAWPTRVRRGRREVAPTVTAMAAATEVREPTGEDELRAAWNVLSQSFAWPLADEERFLTTIGPLDRTRVAIV